MCKKLLNLSRLSIITLLIALSLLPLACSPGGFGYSLTVTVNPASSGNVSANPFPSGLYPPGSSVQLTAIPETDWTFTGWSGDLNSSANPVTITMNGPKTVTATFTSGTKTYMLTYSAGANGSISGASPQTVNYGSNGTAVIPAPAPGYYFVNWSDGSTTNPRIDTNVTANISVTATFIQNVYTLTTSVNPAGEGTVSPSGDSYPSGTSVILTATAATGWTFSGWSGSTDLASTTAKKTTITMKSNETITATFILTSPNVKIQNVTLPSSVIANSGIIYPTTFRLVNNESVNVTVTWEANSSVTGNFDNGSVTVPANGYVDVPKSYVYTTAGPVSLSYSIFYNGDPINSWSGTLNVEAVPNVKIQSVTLPPSVEVSSGALVYNTTFRLVNNESVGVTVNWQGNSSITGNFDSGSVTVPANSYVDVTKNYYYITTGTETITYTIYYNGAQIDSWSGTHVITAFVPNVKIQSVTLPSGAKTSSGISTYPTTLRLVNNESVDVLVTWQVHFSVNGNSYSNYSDSVTVPKNGYIDVTKNYYYTVAGMWNVTYTIFFNSSQLDTWSGTMNVLPGY